MATHLDDEEQFEQLKTWWKDNWVALVAGLGLGFGAIGGWEGYKHWRDTRLETASQMYEEMKKALDGKKADEAAAMTDKLTADFAGTPYAPAAALRLAQWDISENKLDDAAARLGWVVEHAGDDGLVAVARLRKARVLHAQGQHDAALSQLIESKGPYQSLAEELRGDILLAKGDKTAARAAFEKALSAAGDSAPNRDLLQQKLDDLATTVQS